MDLCILQQPWSCYQTKPKIEKKISEKTSATCISGCDNIRPWARVSWEDCIRGGCACQSKQWARVCFHRPHVGDFYNLKSISSEQRLNLDLRNQLFSEITNIMRSIGLYCVKILKLCQVGLSGAGSHTITHFTATKPGE